MQRTLKNRKKRRLGAVAVEFALVIPVFLFLLFTFYEFSRASMIRHATEAAAYEGARAGIVPGATPDDIRDNVAFVLSSVGVDEFEVDIQQHVPFGDLSQVSVTVDVPLSATLTGGLFFGNGKSFTGRTVLAEETL